jgi:hypothetical protein
VDVDELLSYLQQEITDADVPDLDKADGYFNATLPAAPEQCEGEPEWTSVVAPEVRNAVIATLAEILPGFFGDQPAAFPPSIPEDEQQAEDESKLVTHVLFDVADGYEALMRAMQHALLYGFGAVKVWWERKLVVSAERQDNLSLEMVADIVENPSFRGAGRNWNDQYYADVVRTTYVEKPRVEWVPSGELLVGKQQSLTNLNEARFIAHRRQVLASQLIAYGYDPEKVRDASGDDEQVAVGNMSDAARLVTVCESYVLVDIDEDGIAERRRVITAGGATGDKVLLDDRPWPEQPIVVGVPYYSLDDWQGIGLFERVGDLQDTRTDLIRQIIETGWRNLVQRIGGVETLYNHADLVASRRGGVVRLKDPSALTVIPDTKLDATAFSLLELTEKLRRGSGGGAVDTAPQLQQLGGDTAHGIERMASALEQGNALVARNLAETLLRGVYLKLHRLLRRHWQGVLAAKTSGNWLVQAPAQWRERDDVAVTVGLSFSDRMKQAQALGGLIQQQMGLMQAGQDGILVGPQHLYRAAVDMSRLMGLEAPEQYWQDPSTPEAKKAAQGKEQAVEQQKQEQAQAAQAQLEAMLEVEKIRAEAKRYDSEWAHVAKVNEMLYKLMELSAKFNEQDFADALQVKEMYARMQQGDRQQAHKEQMDKAGLMQGARAQAHKEQTDMFKANGGGNGQQPGNA